MISDEHRRATPGADVSRQRRGPLLVWGSIAAVGSAATYLVSLPVLLRLSLPYGIVFAALGAGQLVAVAAVLTRPTRRRALLAAAPALAVLALWMLARVVAVLPAPDPWQPVDGVIGFVDDVCAALEALAVVALAVSSRPGSPRSRAVRVGGWVAVTPLLVLTVAAAAGGVTAAADGFTATAGVPAGAIAPAQLADLPAGQRSTVEYCRPDTVALAMDLYMPPDSTRGARPAPVALYVHGGGVIGDRQTGGLGALLANQDGALFAPLQQLLNARGFVVAAIDYRLPPAAAWPAPIQDARCAVRFLRAHAAALRIDPNRIAAWGSSAGGQLASLLGVAATTAPGFDTAQYADQRSTVQAVVDMFGPPDVTDLTDSTPFQRAVLRLYLGGSPQAQRAASPATYPATGSPPFLILQGSDDPGAAPRQSAAFAAHLRAAGVAVTFVAVQGTGHQLDTPTQRPTPAALTTTVADFLTTELS